MSSDARVTIVIPTAGGRTHWLKLCLDSVAGQAADVEILVVCPASAHKDIALARSFGADVYTDSASGLAAALNIGLAAAKTEFVGWLGDDDLLTVGSLDAAVRKLDECYDAPMVYGQIEVVDAGGHFLFRIRPGRFAAKYMKVGQQFVPQPGSLMRRSALVAAGMLDESLRNAMDLDLFLRLSRIGRLAYVKRPLAKYRMHPQTLTQTAASPGLEARQVRARYLPHAANLAEPVWREPVAIFSKLWARAQSFDRFGAQR